ncbi:DUF2182 domain-containing protein [Aminobacter aganoensis]|uniref:copper chaperone n=1 Tax=Aminobacter aganoensis TaxID=83264 RepID=UPI0031B5827C
MQSYLVRTRHHTILVDGCVGNNKSCKDFAHWHGRHVGTFLDRLATAGVVPEQIDYVLRAHLHADHCSWNTRLVEGRWVPTFANARYVILVWAAAGLLVYVLVQFGSELAASLDPPQRSKWAPLALGATLGIAGLYQFTSLKHICLSHCRSPFAFVAQYWRDGRAGALEMRLRHGVYCFGCCWALFAVLVAAGVMSVAWMLLLTLVVFVEKLQPHGRRFESALGIALVGLGIVVSLGATEMPWMSG